MRRSRSGPAPSFRSELCSNPAGGWALPCSARIEPVELGYRGGEQNARPVLRGHAWAQQRHRQSSRISSAAHGVREPLPTDAVWGS